MSFQAEMPEDWPVPAHAFQPLEYEVKLNCCIGLASWGASELLTWRMGPFSGQSLCVTIGSGIDILATSCLMVIKHPQASGFSFSPSLYLKIKRKA